MNFCCLFVQMKAPNEPAITKWLKQQQPDEYCDAYDDVTVDEFVDASAEGGVSSVAEYGGAGLCGAGMILGREETVESCRDEYPPEYMNLAGGSLLLQVGLCTKVLPRLIFFACLILE